MVLLTFTVLKEQLLAGEKTQTVRLLCKETTDLRKVRLAAKEYRLKQGTRLDIYWKNPRNRAPDCYKVGIGRVTWIRPAEITAKGVVLFSKDLKRKVLAPASLCEDIALKDGFENFGAMYVWFSLIYAKTKHPTFAIVRWMWTIGPNQPPEKPKSTQTFLDEKRREMVKNFSDVVTGKKPVRCDEGNKCDGERCGDCVHNPLSQRKRKYDRYREVDLTDGI